MPQTDNTTPATASVDLPNPFAGKEPPNIVEPDALYDTIMQGIDPELTSESLKTLDEKYANETPEDAKVRAERYEKAFAEYDKQFAAYVATMNDQVRAFQHQAMQSAEQEDRKEEEKEMGDLESAIQSS